MAFRKPINKRTARRIPAAAAIGLAVLASVGTAFAASGNENMEGAIFHIPAARIGDEASYSAALRGDWLLDDHEEGESFALLTVRWLPAEELRDEDGAVRPAEVVRVQGWAYDASNAEDDPDVGCCAERQGPAWQIDNHTVWFEPTTTRMLALGRDVDNTTFSSIPALGPAGPLMPFVAGKDRSQIALREYPDGLHVTQCLAGDDLQGRDLSVGATVELPGCFITNVGHWRPEGSFRATGIEKVAGVDAVRLEGENVTMWWASGIAYPIRYEAKQEIAIDYRYNRGDGLFVLELTGMTLGSQERGAAGTPGSPPAPLKTAARAAWGMDETGIDVFFPLSEAHSAVTEKSAAAANLLKRSPDAYLATATGYGVRSERYFQWEMTLTDGKDAVQAWIAKRTETASDSLLVTTPEVPWPEATTNTTVTLLAEFEQDGSRFPAPRAVPTNWPTVAGVAERWHLYTGTATEGRHVTHWGHALSCPDDACKTPFLYVQVGNFSGVYQAAQMNPSDPARPLMLSPGTTWSSAISVNVTPGRTLVFYDATYENDFGGEDYAGLLDGGSPPSSAADKPERVPGGLLVAGLWSPTQAAGMGLLAILSATVYWLWPTIKSSGYFGLFSRLHNDRLLDEPQRARIVAAVAADPGVHFSELLRRTGIANGTLYHHLQALRKAGHLDARAGQGYTCYFPAGVGAAAQRGAAASKADGAQRILAQVRSNPGLSLKQVAVECGLQTSTVSYHVQRLSDAGLVDAMRDGREVRLWARAAA